MSDTRAEKPQTTFADLARTLDGLEQLRNHQRGGAAVANEKLNFHLTRVEFGLVEFEGTPDSTVFYPMGTVHGGYTAALLDSACGCAVQSQLPAGAAQTTVELKTSYHRPIAGGGLVRAVGQVLSMGKRVAFAEAKLFDANDKLCASATSTLLVFALEQPGTREE